MVTKEELKYLMDMCNDISDLLDKVIKMFDQNTSQRQIKTYLKEQQVILLEKYNQIELEAVTNNINDFIDEVE